MAHENEQEWTAENNGNYSRKDTTSGWVLRYHPNPGGKVNEDGSVTHSMSFPALALTCWIGDAENAAKQIAADLNEVDTLRAERDALREALSALLLANDGVESVLCDGPDVPGFDPTALGKAQGVVTIAEKEARRLLGREAQS